MNNQPAEQLRLESSTLDVHSIFFTLQGEAIHAGRPAVFVRLAGCNIQCKNCDTDYTVGRQVMNIANVVAEIWKHPTRLIVITGGEPFRQNFRRLIDAMPNHEFQIETNGLLCPEWVQGLVQYVGNVKVVISPKAHVINQYWAKSHPNSVMMKYVMNSKYVAENDGLPTSVLGKAKCPPARSPNKAWRIYLQPEDMGKTAANKKNVAACVESCMKYGYTLCLQMQKIVGLP